MARYKAKVKIVSCRGSCMVWHAEHIGETMEGVINEDAHNVFCNGKVADRVLFNAFTPDNSFGNPTWYVRDYDYEIIEKREAVPEPQAWLTPIEAQ